MNTEYFASELLKRVTFQELYEVLTGSPTNPEIMCADCIRLTKSCTTCKQMRSKGTITASIRDWEEDKAFKDCVWFDDDNRIMCKYPITDEEAKSLTENSQAALKRLIHVIKELKSHPESCEKVIKAMAKYKEANDYLRRYDTIQGDELLEVEQCPATNFIFPAVAYKKSLSSDARVCFDGSSTVRGGISLNQRLRRGIVGFNMKRLIQWFLTSPKIALADFRSFYQRFKLHKSQWNLCNFWWFEQLDLQQEAVRYIATVLMFGIISVPRLTLAGLELIGNTHPEIHRELSEQCYVDDLLIHEPTLEECLHKKQLVTVNCEKHGLYMKGWAISTQDPTPDIVESDGSVSFLGLKFFAQEDEYGFKLPDIYRGGAKRKGRMEGLELFEGSCAIDLFQFYGGMMTYGNQLSRTLSYYDPTGLLSPLLMNFKHANREACLAIGNQFKSYLAPAGVQKVCEYMIEMNKLKDYRYKRSKHPNGTKEYDLHFFADSGEKAKQLTSYTTSQGEDGVISVSFFTARNYLANLTRSIPQEELEILSQAAAVALESKINMQGKVKKVYGYTDSKICLAWVKNRDLPLQKFHRSRIAAILRAFTDEDGILQLYYVPTNIQPADLGTKGVVKAEQVSPDSVFFNGPDFLKQPLEESLKSKVIIHIDDPACLNDKKLQEDDTYRQGLAQKLRFSADNDILVQSERLREIERLSQNYSQVSYDKSKLMLEECGYLCNPLNMSFIKFTKTHHYVFAFLLKLISRVSKRNDSGTFKVMLRKWQSEMKETIGFSYICQPDLGDYKSIEKANAALIDLKNLIKSCRDRRLMYGLSLAGVECWMRIAQNLQQDSLTIWPDQLVCEIRSTKEEFINSDWYRELIKIEAKTLKSQKQWDISKAMEVLHTWYRYPGMPIVLANLKTLLIVPEEFKGKEAISHINRLIHLRSYINAYANSDYVKGLIALLMRIYNEVISRYQANNIVELEKVYEDCKLLSSAELAAGQLELKGWIESGFHCKELWLPFQDTKVAYERLQGRDMVDSIFPRESLFAQVQLLTCNLFHTILSKEIRATWSQSKINQHCIVRDNKLVSTWRARALTQTLDAAIQDLEEEDIPHRNLDPRWQSMIPVGDKDSPLIISLMTHIHYDAGLNPLNRVKHYSHRGINYNRLKLYSHVYVPSASLQLSKIMKSCMTCRARDKKKYQAIMGTLHPERGILHHGYLAVQMDQWGPLNLRDDGRYKDLRGRTSTTKVWVLTIICMATKHVTFRVLRSMDHEELARHLTYLSCSHQTPRKIFTDSFASNVNVASQGRLDIRLKNVLRENAFFKYEVCPVGSHEAIGLCESRNKILKKFLGDLKVDRTTPIYELESALELAAMEINNVPLGVTLESDDPTLAIITPNILIDRGNMKRVPVGPIRVPRGFSEIKSSLERRWEEIGNLIQTSVIPEMLDNSKYLYDKGTPLQKGDIVMFQKQSSNNYMKNWSLARVKEVKISSDGKARVVQLEYKRPKYDARVYDSQYQSEDYASEETTRDAHDLVKLHPVVTALDVNLRRLYIDLHNSERKGLELLEEQDDSSSDDKDDCIHFTGSAKENCNLCVLKSKSTGSILDTAVLTIFCKDTRGARVELMNVTLEADEVLLQEIANNMRTSHISNRRAKKVVVIGHRYISDQDGWGYSTERLEQAIVSRVMRICPTIEIDPKTNLSEGELIHFTRDKLYVEMIGETNLYISMHIDVEEFIEYEFRYPMDPRRYKLIKSPLRLAEMSQSFNIAIGPHLCLKEEKCLFNIVPRMEGCTRACCCYNCCQERCPDVFEGIKWDEDTCSGPDTTYYACNTL